MARTISKKLAASTIFVLDPTKPFDTDENGMPVANVTLSADGAPNMNRARIIAQRECKSKNVLVLRVETDETKLTVAPDIFFANSEECQPETVYGRDFITNTFKVTHYEGFAVTDAGMTPISGELVGTTTANKLHKYVSELHGTLNLVITTTEIKESRRYMTREKYLTLAQSKPDADESDAPADEESASEK